MVAVSAAVGIALLQYARFRAALSALSEVAVEVDETYDRHAMESMGTDGHDPINSVRSQVTGQPATYDHAAAGAEFLKEHPDFRRHLAADLRGRLQNRYEPLYRILHLSKAEADAFKAVQLARMFIVVTGPDGPLGFAVAPQLSQAEVDQQLMAVLGDERFRTYQDHERRHGVEFAAHQLVMGLTSTDDPLSFDQRSQIVDLLAESSVPFRNGGSASRSTIDWEEARTRAALVLTPPQQAAFERIASREEYVQVREAGMTARLPSPTGTDATSASIFPAGL
ncbi:MAG: hypothetical protein IAE82_05525 [Opitutaceae bacterium]|nr:hypothetical protein [Opitutaceae bacterium]